MLSFEHTPAYYTSLDRGFFNHHDPYDQLICHKPTTRSHCVRHNAPQHYHNVSRSVSLYDLLDLINGESLAPPAHHKSAKGRHHHHHHHHHHHKPSGFATPKKHHHPHSNPKEVQIYSKCYEHPDHFQIQVMKSDRTNDFDSYSIIYKIQDDETFIIIKSENDKFEKVFKFENGSIDLNSITWDSTANVLAVTIPKAPERQTVKPHPQTEEIPQKSAFKKIQIEGKKTSHPHKKQTQLEKNQEQPKKARIVSIPIEFTHSHQDVPLSRSSSKQSSPELSPTEPMIQENNESSTDLELSDVDQSQEEQAESKMPKISKKVTLEDVEDESFIQMDLD